MYFHCCSHYVIDFSLTILLTPSASLYIDTTLMVRRKPLQTKKQTHCLPIGPKVKAFDRHLISNRLIFKGNIAHTKDPWTNRLQGPGTPDPWRQALQNTPDSEYFDLDQEVGLQTFIPPLSRTQTDFDKQHH